MKIGKKRHLSPLAVCLPLHHGAMQLVDRKYEAHALKRPPARKDVGQGNFEFETVIQPPPNGSPAFKKCIGG